MPWPSYPLYPLLAAHAGATPVPVEDGDVVGAISARHARRRYLQPERSDGRLQHAPKTLGALLSALPEHVHVLLDEALIHFQDVEDINACLRLVDAFPRLLVVRTFSKIYGLSGLRAGYAVSSDARLLAAAAPVLGINALSQAAVEHALRTATRRSSAAATPWCASAISSPTSCANSAPT